MLKGLLGIDDIEERQDNLEEFILNIDEDVEDLKKRQDVIRSELDDLQEKVDDGSLQENIEEVVQELEFIQEEDEDQEDDFSPREKQIIRVLLHEDGFLGTGDIAEELDKSKGTVRKYMSMLKDKIELSTRKDGRKTLYRLSTSTQDEILEGSRSITLTE